MIEPTQQLPTGDLFMMRGGGNAFIRPINGNDETMMEGFHRSLSPESVYARYFNVLKLAQRIAHARLDRICHPQLENETVLVVETAASDGRSSHIVAVGRLSELSATHVGDLAIIVTDSYQRQGIGSELLRRLVEVARLRKLFRVSLDILPNNLAMQHLCLKAGMRVTDGYDADELRATFDL